MKAGPGAWWLALSLALALTWGCSDGGNPPINGQVAGDLDAGGDDAQGDGQPDAENQQPDAQEPEDAPDAQAPEDVPTPDAPEPDAPAPQDASDAEPPDAPEPDAQESDAEQDADVPEPDAGEDAGPVGIGETCFGDVFDPEARAPDYDQFTPEVGEHCLGTNHQDIVGVEQVIFFGDSVTQGTPNDIHPLCIENEHFYRNRLAEWLAVEFGLEKGNLFEWGQWLSYSCLYNGEPGLRRSGDFANCSKWGARTDDFLGESNCGGLDGEARAACCAQCCQGGVCGEGGRCIRAAGSLESDALCGNTGKQVWQCLPEGASQATTLFVFTMGGNDVAAITQAGARFDPETPEGRAEIDAGYPTVWALAERTVNYLEEAVAWMKDPARFPNGSYVVFANPFEFTDGTGDTGACSPDAINIPGLGPLDISALGLNLAELGGFGQWARPEVQEDIVIWMTEQFMRIAVEHQADMVWMLESFCGHGFVATGPDADVENRCYREDDPTLWFDISCIHPNDAGHEAIFRLFRDVIRF